MGRLTKRINVELTKGLTYEVIIYKDIEHHETDFNYKALEKLAHYEDLEEQGRLIELPCAMGEEVWIGHKIYSFGESVVNVMYDSVLSIIIAMRDGFVFGRTKEEAEAKLKELEDD